VNIQDKGRCRDFIGFNRFFIKGAIQWDCSCYADVNCVDA